MMVRNAFSAIAFCSALILSTSAGTSQAAVLSHYYPFDVDASDAAGSAHGTLLGGASVASGVLNLDGASGFVQFGEHIVPTSGSYSVAFFARCETLNTSYTEMISQGQSGGPGFYLGKSFDTTVRVSDSWTTTGVPFPAAGPLWHHFALVVDSAANQSSLYIDGAIAGSVPFAIGTTPFGSHTRLGRQFAPYDEFFPGALDEVRIYDGALTEGEVRELAVPAPTGAGLMAGIVTMAFARRRR